MVAVPFSRSNIRAIEPFVHPPTSQPANPKPRRPEARYWTRAFSLYHQPAIYPVQQQQSCPNWICFILNRVLYLRHGNDDDDNEEEHYNIRGDCGDTRVLGWLVSWFVGQCYFLKNWILAESECETNCWHSRLLLLLLLLVHGLLTRDEVKIGWT